MSLTSSSEQKAVSPPKEGEVALVGRSLGEFIVREKLAEGGGSMVFRAEQPLLAREAVIKVLQAPLRRDERMIQRFMREARLASSLDQPYAAHIYAFGAEADGLFWIAMELVRGTPLDKLLETHGLLPLTRFVPLFDRLCEVIQTAHEQGIIHRDIKPANVMRENRWELEPKYSGKIPPSFAELPLIRITMSPVEVVAQALWNTLDSAKWPTRDGARRRSCLHTGESSCKDNSSRQIAMCRNGQPSQPRSDFFEME